MVELLLAIFKLAEKLKPLGKSYFIKSVLDLGVVVFILAILVHIYLLRHEWRDNKFGVLTTVFIAQVFSVYSAGLIWIFWTFPFDIMLGPILLPAVISTCLFVPFISKIFGYKIF
jgi:biotin transporter BioY